MSRIVCTVTNDLSYDQRMIRTCTALAAHGYSVILIGRKLSTSIPGINQPFEQLRLKCWFNKGALFYAEYNLRLWIVLLKLSFDTVVSVDLDTALPGILACKMRNRRSIYDAHEYFTEVPELGGRNFVKWIWMRIGKFTVPRFDRCYTVNVSLAKVFEDIYQVPFGVVRNVPNFTNNKILPLAEREPIILYQGALNAGRGLPQMIDAMRHIKDYTLHLIGDGDITDYLKRHAKERGVGERVIFPGKISPEELSKYTSKAILGINLLEAGSKNYYYSLANKFFDYLHCGVPSVNMDFPEYKMLIEQTKAGICTSSIDPGQLAEIINSLLQNEDMLISMIEKCDYWRREFNWENEEGQLLGIFNLSS